MKIFKKGAVTLALVLFSSIIYAQSISGPSSAYTNETKTYTYDEGIVILYPNWEVTNGTLLSTAKSGTLLTISVKWGNSTGTGTIKLYKKANLQTTKSVTITNLNGGTISGNQSICYNGIPSSLNNVSSATGGLSGYSYQWQSKSVGASTWSNISGATGTSYAPSYHRENVEYRRRVISGSRTAYSNTVEVMVYPLVTEGVIGNAQTICYNGNPSALTNVTSAGNGNGSYAYQWQGRPVNGSWSNISGATSATYDPPTLTANREYRRAVTSCGHTKYSNIITITVRPDINAGSIGGQQTICYNSSASVLGNSSSASGGNGAYAYFWQRRTIGGSWGNISGATNSTYSPGTLTSTYEYRRGASSCGRTAYSNVVRVTVNPAINGGSISGNQTICYRNVPSTFGSSSSASGGVGTFNYQWQQRAVAGGSWTNISGANSTSYTAGQLGESYEFRRVATNSCGTVNSNTILVNVYEDSTPGSITGSDEVCYGTDLPSFTNTPATGGNLSYAYQWEASFDGTNWASIAGATGVGYNPPPMQQTTHYRRKVTTCAKTKYTNAITITVSDELIAGNLNKSEYPVCYNTSVLIKASAPSGGDGTFDYQWEIKDNENNWVPISGETTAALSFTPTNQTTYVRRQVTNSCGVDYSNVATITKLASLDGGDLATASTTVCSGSTFTITSGVPPTGGDNTYTYQWQWASPGETFHDIIGETDESIEVEITEYKGFRRQTFSCGQTKSSDIYIFVDEPLLPGSITRTESFACYGTAPALIQGVNPASGGNNSYQYQWQKSIDSGVSWDDIPQATGANLNPPAIYENTLYRRGVQSGACQMVFSNEQSIDVKYVPALPTLNPGQTDFYNGGTVNFTYTEPGLGPAYRGDYYWQKAAANSSAFNNQGSNLEYTAPAVNGERYRIKAVNECGTTYTPIVQINVLDDDFFQMPSTEYFESANGRISIQNYTGDIDKWQIKRGTGAWQNIANSQNKYFQDYSNEVENVSYRVVIKGLTSGEINLKVIKSRNAYIAGPLQSEGAAVDLSVQNLGSSTILGWYYTQPNTINTDTLSRFGTYSFLTGSSTFSFTNLQQDTYFRVRIQDDNGAYYTPWKLVRKLKAANPQLAQNQHVKNTVFKDEIQNLADSNATTDKAVVFNYADGLGRTVQGVVKSQSPTLQDIVSFQQYDQYGRSTKTYLPFTTSGSNYYADPHTLQSNFYNGGTAHVPADNSPFAEIKIENSPRQRVIEQGAAGDSWQLNTGHTVKYAVTYNTANTVRKWAPDGTSTGYYPANTLALSTTTDENGNRVRTYTDSRGLTILKQVEHATNTWLSTYHIYDHVGKTLYTLPPKAVELLGSSGTLNVANPAIAGLIYAYTYDPLGRLVEKKVPGAAPQYIIYDNLDRVVLTQDGNQRANAQWMFVKYDRQNRPVYSGTYTNSTQTTRLAVQALFDALNYDDSDPYFEKPEVNSTFMGYSNSVFPTVGLEILTVNYYDNYDFNRNGTPDYTYDNTHLAGQQTEAYGRTRGLPTGSKVKVLGTTQWLGSAVFYDNYGRTIQQKTETHKGTPEVKTIVYNFRGEVTRTKATTHGVNTLQRMEYDHAGRLTDLYHTVNQGQEQHLAHYAYSELSQLIKKDLHLSPTGGGADPDSYRGLQTVDYTYNIRGWLTSINDPGQMTSDKLFGMKLYYNETMGGMSQTGAYNGNITGMQWKNNLATASSTKAYSFGYDKSDRLKTAQYGEGVAYADHAGHYNLSNVNYDANGNIAQLNRKAPNAVGIATNLDNLTYTYNGNQLTKVEDSGTTEGFANGTNMANEYTYDTNGNMMADQNKAISHISYNLLNKADTITFADGTKIVNIYNATGAKLTQELYIDNVLQNRKDYIGNGVYENDTLQFIAHPEGRAVIASASEAISNVEYQYTYTDHLGNTRMVYTSAPEEIAFLATMENTGQDQADDAFYTGIDNTRMTDPRLGKENNEVAHLYATQPIGPGLTVPVYPGDTIEMSVKAFHLGGDFSNTTTATALASALASAFTGISGATTEQGLNTAFNDAYGGAIIGNGTGTRPSAYLNYILFDKNMQAQHFGYVQVSELGAEETLSAAIVSDVEGFVFTYVSNESGQVGAEVYFDDFEVTIKESLVVQSTDYYPFGLQHSTSWTRVSNLKNNFLYNAGSELNEKTKNYEMFYREYDAALGRMTAIDPMAIKYSSLTPYNYSFNDPIAFNDPLGDDPNTGLYGSRSSTPREGGVSDFVWDASEQYGFYKYYGQYSSGRDLSRFTGTYQGMGSGDHWSDQYRSFGNTSTASIITNAWNSTSDNHISVTEYDNGKVVSFRQTDDYVAWGDGMGNGGYRAYFSSGVYERRTGTGLGDNFVRSKDGFLTVWKFNEHNYDNVKGFFVEIQYYQFADQLEEYSEFNWIMTARSNLFGDKGAFIVKRPNPMREWSGPTYFERGNEFVPNDKNFSRFYGNFIYPAMDNSFYAGEASYVGMKNGNWNPIITINFGFKYQDGQFTGFYPIFPVEPSITHMGHIRETGN